MSRRVHVIINPAAGQEKPILGKLNSVFHQNDIDWQVSVTLHAGDAYQQAKQAVENGVDIVGAYGGDGTLMEVANGVAGTDVPMAILPGGTANVLSAELSIPREIGKSAALMCKENLKTIHADMGSINNHHFLLNVGIGVTAEMVKGADRENKNRYGILAYFIAALRALLKSKNSVYNLTLDGKQVQTEGLACMIANIGSTGILGLKLSKKIRMDDGILDIIVMSEKNVSALLASTTNALFSEEKSIDTAFEHWQAKNITLETDPKQPVNADGEMTGETPMKISVWHKAVHIVIP